MPAVYIDTMVQFRAARSRMRPVYITSKTRGRVLVPCANTLLVRPALILANTYNPNSVSGDKLELLVGAINGRSKIRFEVNHGDTTQYTDYGVMVIDTAVKLSGQ